MANGAKASSQPAAAVGQFVRQIAGNSRWRRYQLKWVSVLVSQSPDRMTNDCHSKWQQLQMPTQFHLEFYLAALLVLIRFYFLSSHVFSAIKQCISFLYTLLEWESTE